MGGWGVYDGSYTRKPCRDYDDDQEITHGNGCWRFCSFWTVLECGNVSTSWRFNLRRIPFRFDIIEMNYTENISFIASNTFQNL